MPTFLWIWSKLSPLENAGSRAHYPHIGVREAGSLLSVTFIFSRPFCAEGFAIDPGLMTFCSLLQTTGETPGQAE